MKLQLHPEFEVVHVHLDCPACGSELEGTDFYGSPCDLEPGDSIACEMCGTRFRLIQRPKSTLGDDFKRELDILGRLDEFKWKQIVDCDKGSS